MAINSISGSPTYGIQRGMQGIRRAAVEITQGIKPDGNTNYARSMVEMQQHALQAKASTRALKAYNETLGTLLDIEA